MRADARTLELNPPRLPRIATALFVLFVLCSSASSLSPPPPSCVVTSSDLSFALSECPFPLKWQIQTSPQPSSNSSIVINDTITFQTITGIGSSLEASSCYNIARLSPAVRQQLMTRLFDVSDGIGLSLMRITIGTSDFTPPSYYSYDDSERPDPTLSNFSVAADHSFLLPCILHALRTQPQLLLFASPWSAPGWMKQGGKMEGGWLKEEYYGDYARYLLKFIQAYAASGVPLHAITVQNEPLASNKHYPTTLMFPHAQIQLIARHIGPLLRNASSSVRIWAYDHNFDGGMMDYPQQVLRSAAREYIDGIAYHNYAGDASSMSHLHDEFPSSSIYFTEGSVYGVDGARSIVQYFRNWAQSYNAWVTMLDDAGLPNSGPFTADPTMVQLSSSDGSVVYRYEYYMYGHFSKFIRPGAIRVSSEFASPQAKGVDHVAFVHDGGQHVVILVSHSGDEQVFELQWEGWRLDVPVCSECVVTVVW